MNLTRVPPGSHEAESPKLSKAALYFPDGFVVTRDLAGSMLALIFFTAGLAFWTYSWWNRDRAESLTAFVYAAIFCAGGIAILVVWRFTSP
jgi:hypothetical protein